MLPQTSQAQIMLELSARLIAQNKAFTSALKARRPHHELKAIHSSIQETYNHISFLRKTERSDG